MRKAQIATEFIVIFSIFLVAMILIVLAVWNNIANAEKSTIDFEANRILGLASGRINTAYLEGSGFSIGLAIPEKIGVYDYVLQFDGSTLWLYAGGVSYPGKLLTPNITGTLAKGENTITNSNGMIVIT
jgi:hypothetical protein